MTRNSQTTPLLFYAVAAIVVIGGYVFWQSDLTSDPPMYYTGLGQSLSTDPAQYTYHARNRVVFDDWDPFDYPRWTVYQHSLTSLTAYLWFSVAGVSLRQANMVGVLLSLGGLVFFLLAVARHHRAWIPALVALCYVISVTLLTYGRLSYLENGLVFISGLFFWVYSRWGRRLWATVLAAVLIVLATFTGKLFGALLLPALLLAVFFSGEKDRIKKMILAVACYIVGSLVLMFVLYGSDLSAAFSYAGEQTYGLRGFPAGLSSPWGFVEYLISYGFKNRLLYLDPDVFMFILVSGGLLILVPGGRERIKRLTPAARLSLFWVFCVILGLMPLNYSPLRYSLFLIPAVIVLCFTMFDLVLKVSKPIRLNLSWPDTVLLGFVLWYLCFHLAGNLFHFNTAPFPRRLLTWSTLPVAAVLAFLCRLGSRRIKIVLNRRFFATALLCVVGLSVLANGFRIRRWHFLENNFNIVETNQEIPLLLSEGAVLSGPYGPALTSDNKLPSFIHLFGVAEVDTTLFDRQPITHLAVDISNWQEAVKGYPQLQDVQPIASFWIRDYAVNLYNISKVFRNPEANRYRESAFEQAVAYYYKGQFDSALVAISPLYKRHRTSKSVALLTADLLYQLERFDEVRKILAELVDQYPTDFNVQLQYARLLQMMGLALNDMEMTSLAQVYYARAVDVNRYKAAHARRLYEQIQHQMQTHMRGGDPTQGP